MNRPLDTILALDNMHPTDHPLLQGKSLFEQIRTLVDMFFVEPLDDQEFDLFLNTPNQALRCIPSMMIQLGNGEFVRDELWRISIGQPD